MEGQDATLPPPTYFTCTLGQAKQLREQDGCHQAVFTNVLDLIEKQSKLSPRAPALGLADFTLGDAAASCIVTFERLSALSHHAANVLKSELDRTSKPGNIGLLCISSIDFTLTWLGLMRLGYSVLFIAPQLEPQAIQSLCDTLQVQTIFVHAKLRDRTSTLSGVLDIKDIPTFASDVDLSKIDWATDGLGYDRISEVAYYCHTSGTSSGQPKPIPQYHKGMIAALHPVSSTHRRATFSTTPLYHGGFPDCFRAWSSGSMVWFFPEGAAPITGRNVHRAVRCAQGAMGGPTMIKYFSSVPYILQLLAEEEQGLALLREMDIVGVGGAALATRTGDELVADGVRLVSRMGSAECGFLMSSHRNFDNDKEWQFLRPVRDLQLLQFESRDAASGLHELVVKPSWPCLVKTNRDEGSYATCDLFEPHATIPHAWRYHSRADAQITLANGKKFDPSPVEASIAASSQLLVDVLVLGTGREYAGALLFVKDDELTADQDVIDELWPVIQDINGASQSHTRISKSMLRVLRAGQRPLEKSSKGTIIRSHAEKTYARDIEALYAGPKANSSRVGGGNGDIPAVIKHCFFEVVGRHLHPEMDLYRQGIDSIACVQVRKLLESRILGGSQSLPLNVVYDQGTMANLVRYMESRPPSHGPANCLPGPRGNNGPHEKMQDLVIKYSRRLRTFNAERYHRRPLESKTVLLTGATGFLGSHILALLCKDVKVDRVYSLVRADSDGAAGRRVAQSLKDRGLASVEDGHSKRIACISSRLDEENLGLSVEAQDLLLREHPPTHILHSAWAVNFALRLDSFESQIASTVNMLNLAVEVGAHFTFVSSTAAVTESSVRLGGGPIPETQSQDPGDASPLGYSQSKWVAEHICAAAAAAAVAARNTSQSCHHPQGATLRDSPVSVARVGQLCSNAEGIWNMSEAYPLMLSTARITGCLPNLESEVLSWLPVQVAAQAVVEASVARGDPDADRVLHILNSNHMPSWAQTLAWIQEDVASQGAHLDLVTPEEWLRRLEEALPQHPHHPSQALLGLWKEGMLGDARSHRKAPLEFCLDVTKATLPAMSNVVPLGRHQILGMWHWVREQRL